MIHIVSPGFRGGNSQPYPVLNKKDLFGFSVATSEPCFFKVKKKKKKADHQQTNLDPRRFYADAQ